MSYDLYLKPCTGSIDQAAVLDYFRGWPNYTVEGEQAGYDDLGKAAPGRYWVRREKG